jgi:hypothetical protein
LLGDQEGNLLSISEIVSANTYQKMLVDAHLHSTSTALVRRIYSVFFFGAPHRGLENEKLRELTKGCWSENLVNDLSPGSVLLTQLNKTFAEATSELKIVTCVELEATPEPTASPNDPTTWTRTGPSKFMVDKNSACLYYENEQIIEINKNHSMIAKLSTQEPIYERILRVFRTHSEEAVTYIASKLAIQEASTSLRQVLAVMEHFPLFLESLGRRVLMRSTSIAGILQTVYPFLRAFGNFLEKKNARILFLEPARQQTTYSIANHICNLIQGLERKCLSYQVVVPQARALAYGLTVAANERRKSIPAQYEHLFQPRPVSLLVDASLRTMQNLKLLMCLAALRDRPGDLTVSMDVMKDISVAEILERQRALRGSSQGYPAMNVMSGSLLSDSANNDGLIGNAWKVRTLTRSTEAGSENRQVLIEYRSYDFNPQNNMLSADEAARVAKDTLDRKRRLGQLVYVLQNLYISDSGGDTSRCQSVQDSQNCILKCLGHLDDHRHKRIALLFEVPFQEDRGQLGPHSMKSLFQYLSEINSNRASNRLSLRQRFELARTVCDCVLRLHCYGWLHKDIRSEHVLIVNHSTLLAESTVVQGDSALDAVETEIQPQFSSYLTNFGVARDMEDASSLVVSDDMLKSFYRHPERQGNPERATAKHDWYAVGVLMLEIGLCRTVHALFAPHIDDANKKNRVLLSKTIQQLLLDAARKYLPAAMGPCYAEAVVKCLTGDFGIHEEADTIAALCLKIQDTVLEVVEYGCRL